MNMKTIERTTFANVISVLVDLTELKQIHLISITVFVYLFPESGDENIIRRGGKSNQL